MNELERLNTGLEQTRAELALRQTELEQLRAALDTAPTDAALLGELGRVSAEIARLRTVANALTAAIARVRNPVAMLDLAALADEEDSMFEDVDPSLSRAVVKQEEARLAAADFPEPDTQQRIANPLAATVQVTAIQERVALHEQALADMEQREMRLYGDTPALIRPALLDSVWAESGQSEIVRAIAFSAPAADDTGALVELDTGLTPLAARGYHANVALAHEYVSPLLFDPSTSYEHGDAFGISDTFNFARQRPRANADDVDEEEEEDWRDFQHRFAFTPSRFDVALSLQTVSESTALPLSTLDLAKFARPRNLTSPEAQKLGESLYRTLTQGSTMVPELFSNLDAQQAGATVLAERATVPYSPVEPGYTLTTPSVPVSRYRRLESLGSYPLSRRAVLESTARSEQRIGAAGAHNPKASLLPDELVVPTTKIVVEPEVVEDQREEPLPTLADNEVQLLRDKRLLALADIERALAEYDGTAYGVLRTQSADRRTAGPFYVVDRVREYELSNPLGSLATLFNYRTLAEADSALENRLQRHAVQPLSVAQRTPLPYNEQYEGLRSADEDDVSSRVDDNADLQFAPYIKRERDALVLDDRALARADALSTSSEPATTAVLQAIEDDTRVRDESRARRKRRLVRKDEPGDEEQVSAEYSAPPPMQSDVPEGSGGFEMESSTHFLQSHMKLAFSMVKRKTLAAQEEPAENDDEDEGGEAPAEGEGEEVEEDEGNEEAQQFDAQLAAGAELVRGSPALFERGRASGYFGPVVGVPSNLTQATLLRSIAQQKTAADGKPDWRASARLILLAAIFFKLVPELYSDDFPEEAVAWLVAALRLFRERVDAANELYTSNIASAYAKMARMIERREIDMPEEDNEDDDGEDTGEESSAERRARIASARAQILEAAGVNTAVLPVVLVVDADPSVGQLATSGVRSQAARFSQLDRTTVALVYATHHLRPLADVISAEQFVPTRASEADTAALSYPALDTYGRDIGALVATLGANRAATAAGALLRELQLADVEPDLALVYRIAVESGTEERRLAGALARSVYAQLERGERNEVEFVYLPLPPALGKQTAGGVTQEAIERAVALFAPLHGDNGALNTTRVIELAVARVRDRRTLAERVLLQQCAAPTYAAAAQHYANEHFAPHGSALELVYNESTPAGQPFAVYRDEIISLVDSLRALLSTDWLGRGRVFVDALETVPGVASAEPQVSEPGWVPFYSILAPRRLAEWLRSTALLAETGGDDRVINISLAEVLQEHAQRIDALLAQARELEETIATLTRQYVVIVDQLYTALVGESVQPEKRALSGDSLDDLLGTAARMLVNNNLLLFINWRRLVAPRTEIPFPAFYCEAEPDAVLREPDFPLSERDRRTLAEMWYNAAQRLDWLSLGYLSVPFSNITPLPLAPPAADPSRYETYEHVYTQFQQVERSARAAELRFLMAREASTVHTGRTLWFEETLVHSDPVRFGNQVRSELQLLVQWIKTRQRVALIDYAGVLAPLVLQSNDTVALNTDAGDFLERVAGGSGDAAQLVRSLDPRYAELVERMRTTTLRVPDDDALSSAPVLLPYGNHKQATASGFELAQALYNTTNVEQPFPRRVYETPAARANALLALRDYTRRAVNEEQFADVQRRVDRPASDVRTPEEWLADIKAVRDEMTAQRARITEARTRTAQGTLAAQNTLATLRKALADASLPALAAAARPTAEQLATIERTVEQALQTRARLLDAYFIEARNVLATTSDSQIVQLVDRAFQSADAPREPDLRNAMIKLLGAMRAEVAQPFFRSDAYLNLNLPKNDIFSGALARRLVPVRRALDYYRFVLAVEAREGPLVAGRVDVDEDDDEEEDEELVAVGDPRDLREVLARLLERYESEVDRLQLLEHVATASNNTEYQFGLGVGSIPAVYVALLMPAAIERARIRLYAANAKPGKYELAFNLSTPQTLRIAELVRRYCLYGEMPFNPAERTVFTEYAGLVSAASTGAGGEPSEPAVQARDAHSALLLDAVPNAARDDEQRYVLQRYTLNNGLHHRLPFGSDLCLSVLWLRLMRLYLQYQRHRAGAFGVRVPAEFGSLRALYSTAQQWPYRRELTRTIADMPLAADRCQLYMALMFADTETQFVSLLPRNLVAYVDVELWRERAARAFFPLIEEMRPIDVRLLAALVTGFDYSVLRRRERRDPFNPERFNEDGGDDGGAASDDDADDKSVEDAALTQNDGRDAAPRFDTRYIYRRALAAKETLVDAYYRMVLEEMFAVQDADVASAREAARQRQQAAPNAADLQVVYQVVRVETGQRAQSREEQYSQFIAPAQFETRVDTSGVPVRRIVTLASTIAARIAGGDRALVTRGKMLAVYRLLVRDPRLEPTKVQRAAAVSVLSRRVIFEQVGSVHTETPGAQVHEFSSQLAGRGYASTERALLAAAVRHRIFEREEERQVPAAEIKRLLNSNQIFRTHREPAWHLVPRAALVGAMQVLASRGNAQQQAILFAALETVSHKLDFAQHLWHNDATETPTREERDVSLITLPPPPPLQPLDVQQQPEQANPAEAIELAVRQQVALQENQQEEAPVLPVPIADQSSLAGLVAIAAANNTDVQGWRRVVERNIGRLLSGSAATDESVSTAARLQGAVAPPDIKSQKLLEYEVRQMFAIESELRATTFTSALLEKQIRPLVGALRNLFDAQLDVGGRSELFSEASVSAQRAEIMRAVPEALGAENVDNTGLHNLFWLLARTEARRRARWRVLVSARMMPRTEANEVELARVRSLTDDVEQGDDDQESTNIATRSAVRYYSYFSALFYAAVEEALRMQTATRTAPRRIIEDYVAAETKRATAAGTPLNAQAAAAEAFLQRNSAVAAAANRPKAPVQRFEVERYVPVHALLEALFFVPGQRAGQQLMLTNQYHPLMPLLVAPVLGQSFVRFVSAGDSTTSENTTLTSLAGPLYPGTAAAFEPNEVREMARRDNAKADVWLLHEFEPRFTNVGSRVSYKIVNAVQHTVDVQQLTVDALLRRIATTPLDRGTSVPMIRFSK